MPSTLPSAAARDRTNESLYDLDFVLWTKQQARLLRSGELQALDLENIAEELESMGNRDRRKVESHLTVIMTHLLKLRFQPERRSGSWIRSIVASRIRVQRVVKDSPSLRHRIPELIADVYPDAVSIASAETGLAPGSFPAEVPFDIEEILNRPVSEL